MPKRVFYYDGVRFDYSLSHEKEVKFYKDRLKRLRERVAVIETMIGEYQKEKTQKNLSRLLNYISYFKPDNPYP